MNPLGQYKPNRAERRRVRRAGTKITTFLYALHPSGVNRASRRSQIRETGPEHRGYRKQHFGRWRRGRTSR